MQTKRPQFVWWEWKCGTLPAHSTRLMPSSRSATAAAAFRLRHPPAPAPAPVILSGRWLRIRIRAPDGGGGGRRRSSSPVAALTAEGPSCLFVGPIETASKEMLEALYRQARDSYYSGKPLIGDDMFDKVELKLRLYGSKSVVKYPRCSLRRQSTYADAEDRKTLPKYWL